MSTDDRWARIRRREGACFLFLCKLENCGMRLRRPRRLPLRSFLPPAARETDGTDGLTRLIPVQALTDSGMQFRIEIQRNSRELEWAAEERTMRRPPAKRRRRTGNMLEFLQFATRGARVGSSINDVRTLRTKRGGGSVQEQILQVERV